MKEKYNKPEYFENRELSWLQFNKRILMEAKDKNNLLFEKMKFLSITASNLDEFFMIRVASLIDMVHADYDKRDIAGMTPYEQAKMYDNDLPFDEKARWIVISNFAEIWIYDMNQKKPELVKIQLADLQSKYHMLDFLMNKKPSARNVPYEFKQPKQSGETRIDRNEVDRILDKLSRTGINSLTPEEVAVLEKVREQMNRKN